MSNAALRLDINGQHSPQASYQPRSPRNTEYHRLVEDNYEELESVWDSVYQHMYGYWRPHILDVIYKYLDCGDPHLGFARVKCTDCNTEYLLPFSCKCRGFCPSCHQRRVVEFGEYLHDEVLEPVPHRQWVFTIPKRLRPYFMHNRKLLAKLSLCAWEVLSDYLKTSVAAGADDDKVKAGAVIAVQTFSELVNFNPHYPEKLFIPIFTKLCSTYPDKTRLCIYKNRDKSYFNPYNLRIISSSSFQYDAESSPTFRGLDALVASSIALRFISVSA